MRCSILRKRRVSISAWVAVETKTLRADDHRKVQVPTIVKEIVDKLFLLL